MTIYSLQLNASVVAITVLVLQQIMLMLTIPILMCHAIHVKMEQFLRTQICVMVGLWCYTYIICLWHFNVGLFQANVSESDQYMFIHNLNNFSLMQQHYLCILFECIYEVYLCIFIQRVMTLTAIHVMVMLPYVLYVMMATL